MSTINNDYSSQYNTNVDFSSYFGISGSSASSASGVTDNAFSLADYASIKNGSYSKLLKAYYANQDAKAEKGDSAKSLTLMKSGADALKKSADALNDASLWEKKKIKKKDEKTGQETEVEDYDWEAITKAVKSFIDNYNSMVEKAGDSDTKGILRTAAWMTSMTERNSTLLSKAGITIGEGNKLKLDEDTLKKANMSTLKSLFTGPQSYSAKIAYKASQLGTAASHAKETTYTKNGDYSKSLSQLVSGEVDEEA